MLEISFDCMMNCKGCPAVPRTEGVYYPPDYPSHLTCPRDELVSELGEKTTPDILVAGMEKHGIRFSGQVGWSSLSGDFVPLECPNAGKGVPGIITAHIKKVGPAIR